MENTWSEYKISLRFDFNIRNDISMKPIILEKGKIENDIKNTFFQYFQYYVAGLFGLKYNEKEDKFDSLDNPERIHAFGDNETILEFCYDITPENKDIISCDLFTEFDKELEMKLKPILRNLNNKIYIINCYPDKKFYVEIHTIHIQQDCDIAPGDMYRAYWTLNYIHSYEEVEKYLEQ